MPVKRDRLRHLPDDAARDCRKHRRVSDTRQGNDELIATHAGNRVTVSGFRPQYSSHRPQHMIPGGIIGLVLIIILLILIF